MQEIRNAAVLGAGMMGAEIALCFAIAGIEVTVKDVDIHAVERGISRAGAALDKLIRKDPAKANEREQILSRLHAAVSYDPLAEADFLVEAVFEDPVVKGEALADADRICKPECIFSTNTSSLRVTTLATHVGTERRKRFIGTQFFSPVSLMKLVEVVPGLETEQATVDQTMDVCQKIGKTPIWTKDVAGFAVNRLLHAMMIEAERCVEEGVASAEDIDLACKLGLGHPIGPFQLMDLVTNELILDIQNILQEAYGPRFMPRPVLKQKVDAGHSGRKSGRGWYEYSSKP